MIELTAKQREILGFLVSRWEDGQPLPTVREICRVFDYASPRAAADHLAALTRKGYLARTGGQRGLYLTEKALGVPILGSIPAGFPVGEVEDAVEWLPLNTRPFGVGNRDGAFFLRVRGNSMIGRRIFEGDLVLVEKTESVRNQDIVAALIDNESTLKTFIQEDSQSWLRSENPEYPDLTPAWDLQIQGVARAVVRPL